MKGQFFIISTVIIIAALALMVQYFYDYSKVDLTKSEQLAEADYVYMIKNTLRNAANISYHQEGCTRVDADLNETEKFFKDQLIKKGISFNGFHSGCPNVNFQFNLTSNDFNANVTFAATVS